jgi:hypothetical protein
MLCFFKCLLFILKRVRDRCVYERPHKKRPSMRFLIIMAILENFCEDAHGRDDHGHASKSKELR